MKPLKFSYFQLTFGQQEAYLHPEKTYERLKRCGYDAIEITPPKGRYGLGVKMEDYLETHKKLEADFGLQVSCINECWGEEWDPFSPTYKTLTEPKTADLAVSETKSSTDFAAELGQPLVSCHGCVGRVRAISTYAEERAVFVEAVRQIAARAQELDLQVVMEVLNRYEAHLLNTGAEALDFVDEVGAENVGLLLDAYHMNIEETDPAATLRHVGTRLWLYHAADSNRQGIGRGHTDFEAQLSALADVGYAGPIILEPWDPEWHRDTIDVDLNYLRKNILGSNFSLDLSVKLGAGSYLCGEELTLLESLEGRRGIPRNRPPYPVTHGYLQLKCRAQAINGATLELGVHGIGVDCKPTIDGRDDTFDGQFTFICYRNFDRVGGITAKGEMGCDTHTTTFGSLLTVVYPLCDKLQQT